MSSIGRRTDAAVVAYSAGGTCNPLVNGLKIKEHCKLTYGCATIARYTRYWPQRNHGGRLGSWDIHHLDD